MAKIPEAKDILKANPPGDAYDKYRAAVFENAGKVIEANGHLLAKGERIHYHRPTFRGLYPQDAWDTVRKSLIEELQKKGYQAQILIDKGVQGLLIWIEMR